MFFVLLVYFCVVEGTETSGWRMMMTMMVVVVLIVIEWSRYRARMN